MGILSGTVIAMTGTLRAEPNQIRKWVEANGGKWSPRVEPSVTHLIASKEAWARVTDPVMQAAELKIHTVSYDWLEDSLQGKRRLAEKKYRWDVIKETEKRRRELKKLGKLSDSKKFLEGCKKIMELTGSGTSKKLPPLRKPKPSKSFFFAETLNTQYVSAKDALMQIRAAREAAEAAEKAAKAAKKASASGIARAPIMIEDTSPALAVTSLMPKPPPSASSTKIALKPSTSPIPSKPSVNTSTTAKPQAKKTSLKDLYHYYLDSTGFEYKVTLARSNFAQNQITRYQISILESHTRPHTYCTFVQYTPPIGGAPGSTSNTSDANIRNPLLNFLRQGKNEQAPPIPNDNTEQPQISHQEATRLRALITPPQDLPIHPAEQARLHTLVTPPTPSPATPYKTLICPMNSPFAPAWRAFRHVFRDLTLLSWEERFDPSKLVQIARAKALNIEPYIYSRPNQGMPVGLSVQEAGMYQAHRGDVMVVKGDEDGYVRNEFKLPGMDEPLGTTGVVGARIWREKEEVRKAERVKREKEEERNKKEKEKMKVIKRKAYDGPLFNGATGRPVVNATMMKGGVVEKKEEGSAVWTRFPAKRKMFSRERY